VRRPLDDERGWLVVTAIFVMTLMVAFGLALLSFTDGQTGQSRTERVNESAFNYAEAALDSQTFILGQAWPLRLNRAYPSACLSTALKASPSPDARCPSATALEQHFDKTTHVDVDPSKSAWQTEIRDNGTDCTPSPSEVTNYFDPAVTEACNPRISWDANGDRQVWVRAQANVRGRRRTLVALIRAEPSTVTFPGYAVNVGSFGTGNNGNKTIINATGSLGIAVRCDLSDPANGPGSYCQAFDTKKVGQVTPLPVVPNIGSEALSQVDFDTLEAFADLNGTHFAGCPNGWDPNGTVVVIDSGDCKLTASAPKLAGQPVCCNSKENPGILIIKSGRLDFEANLHFYGVVYIRNLKPDGSQWLADDASDPPLLTMKGCTTIEGGVAIDGTFGRLDAGSCGSAGQHDGNVIFDPNAIQIPGLAGTAGIVQNSWRETPNPATGP
jgi:hypothetical protein